MFETSENFQEISKALLGVQNRFISVSSDSKGQQGKFAKYDKLVARAKPILTDAGILLMQPITNGEGIQPTITTILIHAESGQYIKTVSPVVEMTERKNKAGDAILSHEQRIGGGISYMKRYALASILAWATGDYDIDQAPPPENEDEKPFLKPGDKNWESAKASYVDHNGFEGILKHVQMTDEHQKLMEEECKNA